MIGATLKSWHFRAMLAVVEGAGAVGLVWQRRGAVGRHCCHEA